MSKTTLVVITALSMVCAPAALAEMASVDDAFIVAENWIELITETQGRWGDCDTAYVETVEEFVGAHQILGYFCRVKPKGYIVISLHKALAPVKAYSPTCDIDPECVEGMTDLLKGRMERVLDSFPQRIGDIRLAQAPDVQNAIPIDYGPMWRALGAGEQSDVTSSDAGIKSTATRMDYMGGTPPLLLSSWHQGRPYNALCPTPKERKSSCTAVNCAVGCTPLAGAQVMRYWAWPPGYDWPNMPNALRWIEARGECRDEDGNLCSQAQIDATAELCYVVGVASDADYCDDDYVGSHCATAASTSDLLDALEDLFEYSDETDTIDRDEYSNKVKWFDRIKTELSQNRPVLYELATHMIVCDGWQEFASGGIYLRQYHMNYGWAGGNSGSCPDWVGHANSNAWYTLDELPCSNLDDETICAGIRPACSLGAGLFWYYGRDDDFPYRYFDQDAVGEFGTFEAGQELQFLPGVTVTCTSTTGDYIQFYGTRSHTTRLFSVKGTVTGGLVGGIKIHDGELRLYRNGSITFH